MGGASPPSCIPATTRPTPPSPGNWRRPSRRPPARARRWRRTPTPSRRAARPSPDRFRAQPLILLGNLNTNRAVMPLYAHYYCATDALYPGGEGYDLRTIVNAYGMGANVILAGGSTPRGVARAVERLIGYIRDRAGADPLTVPYMLDIEMEPWLARQIGDWPNALLGAPQPTLNRDLITAASANGMIYAWTGDARYGAAAADRLRAFNAEMGDSYGDWHYFLERLLRALPWIIAGGFLDEADILHTDQLLLGTALGTQDMWWRMRHDHPPLGHRHHGKGTYEFYLIARYLQRHANPNPAVRALCDRWLAECQTFLDGLARAGIDDQDDESTLNNMATLFWYAMGEERYGFFESGNARRAAERALALHDNMGAGAGQGGYGESHTGAMYVQQEATTAVAACAFYYQDGELKWILENMPNLAVPIRGGFLSFTPIFMHKFDTGAELPPKRPESLSGIQVLPVTPHQQAINDNPPEHIEYQGHMVNAPETWLRGEGIDINRLPRAAGFDKLVIRSGFEPEDAFILLQGYQGGYRWQGHMQAANCIVRFAQAGHIFLIQNTRLHAPYHKNGVMVSDGYNDTLLPPIAEWRAVDDFDPVGITTTRLPDYHHADWTRHIFWSKQGAGFFVVIDALEAQSDGPFTFTCTWRTPGYAELEGRTWQARQGAHRFTLRCSEALPMTNEEVFNDGASHPYVLRQRREGEYRAGDWVTFQNLFYVRPDAAPENLDIVPLAPGEALITVDGTPAAWCAAARADHAAMRAPGLSVQAASAWVTPNDIVLSRATALAADRVGWRFETAGPPLGLHIDLKRGRLSARLDTPERADATLTLVCDDVTGIYTITEGSAVTVDLPAGACAALSAALAEQMRALAPAEGSPGAAAPASRLTASGLGAAWTYDSGTRVPARLRNVTADADPRPVDGFPEQLVDTVLPELRESWQQWPPAPNYAITLTFPAETALDHLTIVGDTRPEPFLGAFRPLPDGIEITLSNDGFVQDRRRVAVESETGVRLFKRYRGMEDRFETRRVNANQSARQVRVDVPAPPGQTALVLHEIELYGTEKVSPPVKHMLSADLNGDGRPQIVLVNGVDELIVLAEDGAEAWRVALGYPVSHVSCHDLDGDGRRAICVGFLGGEIRIFAPDGVLRQTIPLGERFRQRKDAFFGWIHVIETLTVWRRGADGRAALAVGGYSIVVFLDPDGEIVGHSWADGSWLTDLLVVPPQGTGPGDLWARCGWNHGLFHYEGKPGLAPSGASISFGGVDQPMFRALRRVVPFVNGVTRLFAWTPGVGAGDGIVAMAENGVGVLSLAARDWCWKIEGGTPFTAGLPGDINGEAAIICGGYDGFVAAFAQADGRPLRRRRVGAPVVGLAGLLGGALAVATRQGVLVLDADWAERGAYPVDARAMQLLGQDTIVIARADGRLEALRAG
ncbi:MAG: hypothetical protein M5R40_19875 [Anaerolineae bacterium]|nr:hypothetical protein [Anaerolineae bacterium]